MWFILKYPVLFSLSFPHTFFPSMRVLYVYQELWLFRLWHKHNKISKRLECFKSLLNWLARSRPRSLYLSLNLLSPLSLYMWLSRALACNMADSCRRRRRPALFLAESATFWLPRELLLLLLAKFVKCNEIRPNAKRKSVKRTKLVTEQLFVCTFV